MGCASSSPFISANEGLLTGAGADIVHAGEGAINDVRETITSKVDQVKVAVYDAVHSVENAVCNRKDEENLNTDTIERFESSGMSDSNFLHIPLKGNPSENYMQEAIKNSINIGTDELRNETHVVSDGIMKETENLGKSVLEFSNDHESGTSINAAISQIIRSESTNSLDSLKSNSLEPEIEEAMANDIHANPPTPKPTFLELQKLHTNVGILMEEPQASSAISAKVVRSAIIAAVTND